MRDITDCKSEINLYGGTEVKRTYHIDGKKYMVKFPDPIHAKFMSYVNNQYSEYIGCKIFELFKVPVQNVELVKCKVNGKEKVAVMCEDFLKPGEKLGEFKNVFLSLNMEKKFTSNIEDIFEMISKIENLDGKEDFEYNFWYIFIIDTLLGNVDRHLGNWGLIKSKGRYRLSPVYDCGSCLHPLIGEDYMRELLRTDELNRVAVNLDTAYKKENKTLHYLDIYENMPPTLGKALKDIHPLINMNKIKKIIYGLDISLPMKKFYYRTILIRKEEIIDKYYNMLN